MNEHGKNENIENLDLNDANLKVKIKPTKVEIENLDFEADLNVNNSNINSSNQEADKNATSNEQDRQLVDDSFSNNQSQQGNDSVENDDLESSPNEDDLKEPYTKAQGNDQSSNENILNDQSNEEVPENDQTTSENISDNKKGDNDLNDDNSDNKKNENDLNNDNPDNKKNENDLNNDNPDNKKNENDLNNNNSDNKKEPNKDSGTKNNRDKGQNNSDTNKTPRDNKNKNENSSPSKPNNNKSAAVPKEKKQNGLKKKRDDLKNKWNNRPKSPKDFANRAKNGIKKGIKNKYNNSRLGKTINGAKKAIQKGKKIARKTKFAVKSIGAFLKTPVGWAVLGVIAGLLLILILIVIVPSMLASGSPQVGGEVQDEENYSKYSDVDQKTIDKLREFSSNTSGDPSYAMAATLYPYIDEMQNGNVNSIRGKTNNDQSDSGDATTDDEQSNNNDSTAENDNSEDISKEDEDVNDNDDDPYLELLRQRKYQRKFKKLLKKSTEGEDALTQYLKDTWFDSDAGYKKLFEGVTEKEELKRAIIEDLLDQKDDFKGYFYDNCSTSYSTQSGGQVTIDYSNSDGIELQELLTKNIVVDVKKAGCTETGKFNSCESMYSSPISMQQYIIGVTIQEVSNDLKNIEHIKANMIAEKSFAIGRAYQRGNVTKIDDNTYVIGIIDSTRDQDYCDYLTGDSCTDGVKDSYNTYGANLEQAWSESQNMYLYSGTSLIGSVCQNKSYAQACSCEDGGCLFQEEVQNGYETENVSQILSDQFKNKNAEILTSESGYIASTITTSNTTCSNTNDNSNFIYYAQNDYANIAFCGRTLSEGINGCAKGNSICTAGCGVTSAAMAIATLTQNTSITPETINSSARVGTDCGDGGTNASLFPYISNNYGLEANSISTKEDIISTLDSGGLVIASVDGTFGDGIYSNGGGHYVVIRGYSGDNVYIADPWQNNNIIKYCEEFNSANKCTKLSTNFDTFIKNVETHGKAGFYAITGGIPFIDSGSNEILNEGTQNTYFAPVQNVKPSFGRKSSTPGCTNSVYHDISGIAEGTKIYAGADGTANFYQIYNSNVGLVSYGNVVELETSDGTTIIYGHLQKFASGIKTQITKTCPKKGSTPPCPSANYTHTKEKVDSKTVKKGELIGYLGNTGNSTGAHLHVEIKKSGLCIVDPWEEFGMR